MKIARLALAAALLLTSALAQSFTVQLQRAIFLEETAGDLDGAIQLYRQILSAGAEARVYEAEAQYHLGACLLKKGNKPLAARTFQDLMRKHPEETELVDKASIHYLDLTVGYALTVPAGWGIHSRLPYNGGPGSCADIQDPENKATVTICAKAERAASAEIDPRLLRGLTERLNSMKTTRPDFTVRPSSQATGLLGKAHTLTILADFTQGTVQMTEWTTWVQSETTRSSVVVYTRTANLQEFQERFTPILNSYRIP
jgi:hypothetical protein